MDPLRRHSRAQLIGVARALRREATPAERHAWSLLRNRRVLDLKFRRQHLVHGFVVDFYCAAERLVLELDGGVHDGPAQGGYDVARAALLEAAGYRVVRVRNEEVTRAHIEETLRRVLGKARRGRRGERKKQSRDLSSRPPPPSPHGGEGARG